MRQPPELSTDVRPLLLLDTNVLLDALVFDDPATRAWLDALRQGAVVAVTSPAILREWHDVLARPVGSKWDAKREHALTSWPPFALDLRSDPTAGGSSALRCDDPDDQKFIDLALAVRARWLLTRDKALLRLARAALGAGVQVLRPSDSTPGGRIDVEQPFAA